MAIKEVYKGILAIAASDRKVWRKWLEKNHAKEEKVWLILFRQSGETPSVTYPEAVEEALCFGWIDSVKNTRDAKSAYQYFAKRKPKSVWSKSNRERVEKLIAAGQMTESGMALIELAKKTGTWEALVEVEQNIIPEDLQIALQKNKKAQKYFTAFPPSSRRIILEWIRQAKKQETRKKRIAETVRLAAKNIRANHYRQ
ncbi:MAG: YdeI/OmpD-associated family protein [Chitinophagales bacterium]